MATSGATSGHGPTRSSADDAAAESMKERGGVQSIERAFAIIEEVARHRDGIRLGELSRRVGLHTSTTFHLVKTMLLLGYLRQMPDDKSYRIGTPVFKLASSCLDEVEMTTIARPILEELSVATGETSHFAIRSGDDIVVLARTAGSGAFQLMDRVGAVRPAHCTALGKVLLAALDESQLGGFLERRPPVPFTPNSITDPDRLAAEIAAVRRNGIAYDDGEFNIEARCVAVPVHDFTGQVRGAVGISAAVWRLSLHAIEEKSRLIRSAAARMSTELGHVEQVLNGESVPSKRYHPKKARADRRR